MGGKAVSNQSRAAKSSVQAISTACLPPWCVESKNSLQLIISLVFGGQFHEAMGIYSSYCDELGILKEILSLVYLLFL